MSVRSGVNRLYLFSQILMVCAFIPERFSKSQILKFFFTLFIFLSKVLNKFTIKRITRSKSHVKILIFYKKSRAFTRLYVPTTRFELAHPCEHYPLKVACLPISPRGLKYVTAGKDIKLWFNSK